MFEENPKASGFTLLSVLEQRKLPNVAFLTVLLVWAHPCICLFILTKQFYIRRRNVSGETGKCLMLQLMWRGGVSLISLLWRYGCLLFILTRFVWIRVSLNASWMAKNQMRDSVKWPPSRKTDLLCLLYNICINYSRIIKCIINDTQKNNICMCFS